MARNKNWDRSELILAFNLYCKTPFSAISSKNPTIINLANLIGRTPSAVALKLVNFASLDPVLKNRNVSGMSHGSKADKLIWDEFQNDWERLSFESENLLAKIKGLSLERSAKIDIDTLPDEGREREAIVKTRVNQNFFRSAIMASYGYKCCITDMPFPELLVASHIIPWAVDKKNRMNPQNGLCLNSLHDKAFDKGLITITVDYKIKLSRHILSNKDIDPVKKYFLPYDGVSINLPQRFLPDKKLLQYHNEKIFHY